MSSGERALAVLDAQIESTIHQVQRHLEGRSFSYALDATAVLAGLVRNRTALIDSIKGQVRPSK